VQAANGCDQRVLLLSIGVLVTLANHLDQSRVACLVRLHTLNMWKEREPQSTCIQGTSLRQSACLNPISLSSTTGWSTCTEQGQRGEMTARAAGGVVQRLLAQYRVWQEARTAWAELQKRLKPLPG
jgi:hypothetical protein